jgi:hypothetical protein
MVTNRYIEITKGTNRNIVVLVARFMRHALQPGMRSTIFPIQGICRRNRISGIADCIAKPRGG